MALMTGKHDQILIRTNVSKQAHSQEPEVAKTPSHTCDPDYCTCNIVHVDAREIASIAVLRSPQAIPRITERKGRAEGQSGRGLLFNTK